MFPVKFEAAGSNGTAITELSNIQLGAAIPDEAFELPDGIQVMDMGNFMGMMQ
jgi:outer membrane lipoprotein-sorting protein